MYIIFIYLIIFLGIYLLFFMGELIFLVVVFVLVLNFYY